MKLGISFRSSSFVRNPLCTLLRSSANRLASSAGTPGTLETLVSSSSQPTRFSGYIPLDKIEKKYMRSSGPGGQHVNMVNTKCEIRFNLSKADWLPTEIKDIFSKRFSRFVAQNDDVVIHSDKTRCQNSNLRDCVDKLKHMLDSCNEEVQFARRTSEDDLFILKKRAEIAAERRLRAKRRHSEKKKQRKNFCD